MVCNGGEDDPGAFMDRSIMGAILAACYDRRSGRG